MLGGCCGVVLGGAVTHPGQGDRGGGGTGARGEVALFVKLAVVGQESLGGDGVNATTLDG